MDLSARRCWQVKGHNTMGTTLFFQSLINMISTGLGCGTCCSPYISVCLSTYTMSHAQSVKKALKIFLDFFLGKLSAVVLICILTSLLGKRWITKDGHIGNFDLHHFVEIGLLLIGVLLLCRWVFQYKKNTGAKISCGTCKVQTFSGWPACGVGFICGTTPCTPLLLLIGYTVMLPLWESVILAFVFTAASSLSSMLFVVFIGGILSQKMYEEIPKYVSWIRLFCYILFVGMAIVMLITD
jgi:hypothetical protein